MSQIRIIEDPNIRQTLRARLWGEQPSSVHKDLPIGVQVTTGTVPEVEVVKELLPSILSKEGCDEDEAINLVRYLLQYCNRDLSVITIMSELYDRLGDVSAAYVWAFTASALDPASSLSVNRVDLLAENALMSQIRLRDSYLSSMFLEDDHTGGFDILPPAARYKCTRSPYTTKRQTTPSWSTPLFQTSALAPYHSIAKTRILPGDEILSNCPLIAIAPIIDAKFSQIGSTCLFCMAQLDVISGGGYPCPVMPQSCPFKFCSLDCFVHNAPLHQYSCQFIHTHLLPLVQVTGFSAAFILVVVRTLLRSHLAREAGASPSDNDPLVALANLPSYQVETQLYRPELWTAMQHLSKALCHFFPLPKMLFITSNDLDDLIVRIHTHILPLSYRNAGSALQGNLYAMRNGLGLSVAQVSLLTHSCIPNCFVSYEKFGVTVRALQYIRPEEPLCISFVEDLYTPTGQRKNLFASLKVIDCLCGRCRDPSEGGRFVDGQRCESCVFGFACPRRHPRLQSLMTRTKGSNNIVREWECCDCGLLSVEYSRECEQRIARWKETLQGPRDNEVVFRKRLLNLYDEMKRLAHPFHYLFHETCLKLASSFLRNPQRSVIKALHFERLAEVGARAVLPVSCPELLSLSSLRCQLAYTHLNQLRLTERPPALTSILLEPAWRAVWCAYVCYGNHSAEWLFALRRLRKVVALCMSRGTYDQLCSDGLLFKAEVSDTSALVEAVTELWPSKGKPTVESVKSVVDADPTCLWFAACRTGNTKLIHTFLASDLAPYWAAALDGVTGHPSLTVMALNGTINSSMKLLLDYTKIESLLHRDEWGMTSLMMLCARRDSTLDRVQAEIIARILLRVNKLDKDVLSDFLRAQSCDVAGGLQAIHYAAARNKPECLSVLVNHGADPSATTIELASPLHLAAITGSEQAVLRLLTFSPSIQATNYRGETALMMAAFGLHTKLVQLLIDQGSDLFYVTDAHGTSVLHALVAGVTRTCRVVFLGRLAKDDPFEHALAGFNASSVHRVYEPYDTSQKAPTYASVPVIEAESDELLLFPEELSRRLDRAILIVERLRSHLSVVCKPTDEKSASELLSDPTAEIKPSQRSPEDLFAHASNDGFTAAELLMHQWEVLEESRQSLLLGTTDLRFDCANVTERHRFIQKWIDDVSVKVLHLAQQLKPCLENEPVSLQLRQMAATGNRVNLKEVPLDVRTTSDGDQIDVHLDQLLHGKPRQWDSKQVQMVTKSDQEEAKKAKIREEALRQVALARDEEIKKEMAPPITIKPAKKME